MLYVSEASLMGEISTRDAVPALQKMQQRVRWRKRRLGVALTATRTARCLFPHQEKSLTASGILLAASAFSEKRGKAAEKSCGRDFHVD